MTVKYLQDYIISGRDLIDDQRYQIGADYEQVSSDDCATYCSLNEKCKSFNYCGVTSDGNKTGITTCQLFSTHPLENNDAKTINIPFGCRNLFRNEQVMSPVKDATAKNQLDLKSMTGGAFAGLIFGMIFTGLLLGVAGFYGYMVYQARRSGTSAGGLGVSVRFLRQKDEPILESENNGLPSGHEEP